MTTKMTTKMNSRQREQRVRVLSALSAAGRAAPQSYAPPEDAESWKDLSEALRALGFGRQDTLFVGELSLDGEVRPTRALARNHDSWPNVVVPWAQRNEAFHFFPRARVYAIRSLEEALRYCEAPRPETAFEWELEEPALDPLTGRAAEVLREVADHFKSGRSVYLEGPPGCGRTAVARRIGSMISPMSYEEALSASREHSTAGTLTGGLLRQRPFRAPHHTVSARGMRSEVSLALHGVLFLDEAPEFRRNVLEIASSASSAVALAGNPCPCGWAGSGRACECSPEVVARFRYRVDQITELFEAVLVRF